MSSLLLTFLEQSRTTCSKVLESRENLKSTDECNIQIEESRFAGRVIYKKVRCLKGDVGEDIGKWNGDEVRIDESDPNRT